MPATLNAQARSEIVDQLFAVFRDRGYEGSSLADLSAATGLGKSSLYHHFPGGKEQMAEVVLEHGKAFLQKAVVDVARSPEPLKVRIRKIVAAFDQLYAGGRNACVLGRLAIAEIGTAGHQLVRDIFDLWADAIAILARDSGIPTTRARHFADDWIARVQGSLTLHGANGDRKPYERAMHALTALGTPKGTAARPGEGDE